ncbi:MAG: hypothetical protein ABIR26_07580 [Ramlibacter sp.]
MVANPDQSLNDKVTAAEAGPTRRPAGSCSATGTGEAASRDSIFRINVSIRKFLTREACASTRVL